jgi:hypothetical protein
MRAAITSPRMNERQVRKGEEKMKTKTNIKAGGVMLNHNATLLSNITKSKGLKVKTNIKAGGSMLNHNEVLINDDVKSRGLKDKYQHLQVT